MSARWFVIAALAAACGGNGGTGPGDSSTDTTPGGTNGGLDCNALPQFDLDGMDCEELAAAYYDQKGSEAAKHCETADDCHAFSSPCRYNDQISGCFHVTNKCFTTQMVSEYSALSQSVDCVVTTGIRVNACECDGASAPEVQCLNNKCSEVFTNP